MLGVYVIFTLMYYGPTKLYIYYIINFSSLLKICSAIFFLNAGKTIGSEFEINKYI